jgi:hypothetical protein
MNKIYVQEQYLSYMKDWSSGELIIMNIPQQLQCEI